ncbi:hypothetical protein DCC85_20330 [Paenibacillus sp. CAA11]|uniref:ATP synthase subunit I n=1 Tax=Paenibacillus sp. CAA11 TaxID=1532905 RepID=UPI000D3A07A8|nr:ATP synthase subunit I [Paenibacillus sp. CAA11]AWB46279.1 hypothetical protein DCC85_20330 [Paenibacillus sp. CAA11]
MNELSKYRIVVVRVVLFFAAFCLVISAALPTHRPIAHGLILGSFVSCLNVLHMAYKVRKITNAAAGKGKAGRGIGFGTRLATSICAILLPLEYPHYFNEVAVMASLVFAQFLLLILGIIYSLREERKAGKG